MQGSRPFVSVVVPVYNDAQRLRRCLAALREQSYPRDRFEVVVVDNASSDDLRPIVAAFPGFRFERDRPGSYARPQPGNRRQQGSDPRVHRFRLPAGSRLDRGRPPRAGGRPRRRCPARPGRIRLPARCRSPRPARRPGSARPRRARAGASAQPPTNTAGPVLRAGLTDRFVTGMPIRWISVSPRPIAIGAKPAGARSSVAPRMIIRNMNVSTTSATRADGQRVAAGRVLARSRSPRSRRRRRSPPGRSRSRRARRRPRSPPSTCATTYGQQLARSGSARRPRARPTPRGSGGSPRCARSRRPS